MTDAERIDELEKLVESQQYRANELANRLQKSNVKLDQLRELMSERSRLFVWLCFIDLVFGMAMLITGFIGGYSCRVLTESATIETVGSE
jgi:hypothetical protein